MCGKWDTLAGRSVDLPWFSALHMAFIALQHEA
jgi:hypothetical protein